MLNWKTLIQSLPDKIKQSIEDEQIQQEVRKASIETLGSSTIDVFPLLFAPAITVISSSILIVAFKIFRNPDI